MAKKIYFAMSGLPGCMPDFISTGFVRKQDAYESLALVWDVSVSTIKRWVQDVYPQSELAMGCTFHVDIDYDLQIDIENYMDEHLVSFEEALEEIEWRYNE